MGLKRLGIALEVTYAEDDPRTLDELAEVTAQTIGDALVPVTGTLAMIRVLSSSVDPDREISVDDPDWTPPPPKAEPEAVPE